MPIIEYNSKTFFSLKLVDKPELFTLAVPIMEKPV